MPAVTDPFAYADPTSNRPAGGGGAHIAHGRLCYLAFGVTLEVIGKVVAVTNLMLLVYLSDLLNRRCPVFEGVVLHEPM